MTNERKLRTFQRDVLVTLTTDERHERGARLADMLRGISELREDAKTETRVWSNKIKDYEKEMQRIGDAVRDGKETRQYSCYEVVVGNTVETRRVDNDEMISAPRPADAKESQENISFETPGSSILDDSFDAPSTKMSVADQREQSEIVIESDDGDILPPETSAPKKTRKPKLKSVD